MTETIAILICVVVAVVAIIIVVMLMRRNRTAIAEVLRQQQQMHRQEMETVGRQQRLTYEAQQGQLLAEVKALSQQLADNQAARISRESSREIQGVVEPLRQHLENLGQLVREGRDHETAARASLQGQIENLMNLNLSIGEEARQLTQALKGDSKVQGDWGEMQLVTLLEQGGLQQDIHFRTQQTRDDAGRVLRNEQGNQLRPDVVILLPQQRSLVIDSKVSLTAFTDYAASENREQRNRLARKHLDSVKKHIKELAEKNYPAVVQGACDQSIMFIPLEGAFMLALRQDPDLLRFAAEMHVAITTPLHLFSLVQLTAQLWRQDAQERNTQRIAEVGGRLYDKLSLFLANFDKVGETLDRAHSTWSDARAQLSTGRGNALRTAAQLRDLGAKVTRRLPEPDDDE